MKRTLSLFALVILMSAVLMAQAAPNAPSSSNSQNQSGQAAQSGSAQAGATQGGTTSTTTTQMAAGTQTPGTYLPQPKSPEEAKEVQAAMGSNDPAAMEKAADDISTKFPQSEFRSILYERAMEMYRMQDNGDKATELAHKALTADPDSVTALSGLASVLAEKTRETDLDKDERWAEATKAANHLLELGDKMRIPANPNTPPENVAAFRNVSKGMALIALGTIEMNKKNDAAAADFFQKAVATDNTLKDPVVFLRQSVVLDRLKKYPDSLQAANKVVEFAPAGSRAAELGKQQQQRLQKLMAGGGTTPAAAPAGAPTTSPATQPSTSPSTQASDPQH